MTLDRFLQHQLRYEIGFALAVTSLITLVNATSGLMEAQWVDNPRPAWIPWTLETTSGIGILLCLPLLSWFVSWLDLSTKNFRWRVLWHIPAFFAFSFLHVGCFVLLRKIVYWLMDNNYFWGQPVWFEMLYELRKDLITYLVIVLMFYGYEFVLNRLRGEASFLGEAPSALPDNQANVVLKSGTQQFLVKMLQQEFLVKVDDIQWLEAAGNYVVLHCEGRSYPMRTTLSGITSKLDPQSFQRVHRSAIVNLKYVAASHLSGNPRHLELASGSTIPVSQTYLADLRTHLET